MKSILDMCLITSQPAPKEAEEQIICYKIVIKDGGIEFYPIYRTPYQGHILDNDIVKGKKIMIDDREEEEDPECTGRKSIGKGFIHTFADYTDAYFCAMTMYNAIVYECEIPKGSMYYEGHMNNGLTSRSYASKELKFIKIQYKFDKR